MMPVGKGGALVVTPPLDQQRRTLPRLVDAWTKSAVVGGPPASAPASWCGPSPKPPKGASSLPPSKTDASLGKAPFSPAPSEPQAPSATAPAATPHAATTAAGTANRAPRPAPQDRKSV